LHPASVQSHWLSISVNRDQGTGNRIQDRRRRSFFTILLLIPHPLLFRVPCSRFPVLHTSAIPGCDNCPVPSLPKLIALDLDRTLLPVESNRIPQINLQAL